MLPLDIPPVPPASLSVAILFSSFRGAFSVTVPDGVALFTRGLEPMPNVTHLQVNGHRRALDADPDRSLLSVLRDDLGLTGAKYGCGEGQLRRLHRPARRPAGPLVQSPRVERRRRQAGPHHRGARRRRQAAPAPGGVPRGRRAAVRLLHAGHDHVRAWRCWRRTPTRPATRSSSGMNGNICRCGTYHADRRRRRDGREGDEEAVRNERLDLDDFAIEPERYELLDVAVAAEADRRDFFRIAGGGLVVALLIAGTRTPSAAAAGGRRRAARDRRLAPHRRGQHASPSTPARSRSARTSAPR